MKIYNTRSPEQWVIISRYVNFKGKTVLDLGCGKGDILYRAFETGAEVIGIDKDGANIRYIHNTHPEPEIEAMVDDIEFMIMPLVDIIICFSVLPYLKHPGSTLEWISYHSKIAFLECQYAGDGPGLPFLTDNDTMREWLLEVGQFEKVKPIGYTLVEGRDKKRYIWMCE